jgi:histone deacetylase HOS3
MRETSKHVNFSPHSLSLFLCSFVIQLLLIQQLPYCLYHNPNFLFPKQRTLDESNFCKMDPPKLPSTQEDPPPFRNNVNSSIDESHCELTESLNRLTLATATSTPLPPSPRLSNVSSQFPNRLVPAVPVIPAIPLQNQPVQSVPLQNNPNRPVPAIPLQPSSSSARDERRKSLPALQKRKSTASLRSVSGTHKATSPIDASRRTSPKSGGSPTITAASPAMLPARLAFGPAPEPQAPTPVSVAADHFAQELLLHRSVEIPTKIAVVMQDDCYGHRYARLGVTKRSLDSVVERPERIRACTTGISMAYVRLGLRHSGEQFAPNPHVPLDKLDFPFRIIKTGRKVHLSETAVTNVHGTKWMSELRWMTEVAESRIQLETIEVARQHTTENDGLAMSGLPLSDLDLYLCSESLNAFEGALGGVFEGVDAVFKPGPIERVFVCIRPPGHHCSADFPSGFCWINNVHVGISHAATNYGLTHAAILDFDLHHGDGSQDITFDHNAKILNKSQQAYYQQREHDMRKPSPELTQFKTLSPYGKTPIGYYSLHDINSFPCENGDREKILGAALCIDGAHNQSIWNVHLEEWGSTDEFWKLYSTKYVILLDKARNFLRQHSKELAEDHAKDPTTPPPKAAIFVSAGFDASEWEGVGMQRHTVNVPTEFYARFTADVVRMSQEEGLGVDGRVISVLEGGYSDRALSSGVLSHLAGLSEGAGPASQLRKPETSKSAAQYTYNPEWWTAPNLAELEAAMVPGKRRTKTPNTYLASTESSTAKAVALGRDRRSTGDVDSTLPPVPEVPWTVATNELNKQLIPTRQTQSNKAADLTVAAATRRRQEGGDAILTEEGRQLRARKPKAATPAPATPRPATPRRGTRKTPKTTVAATSVPDASHEVSPSVGASRRKTVARATPRRGLSPHKRPPVPKIPDEVEKGVQRLKLRMPSRDRGVSRGRKSSGSSEDLVRSGRVSKSPTSGPPSGKMKVGTKWSGGSPSLEPKMEPKDEPMSGC